MKRILKGLTALMICGALNFGLTTDAQAAELDSSIDMSGIESQEVARHHHYPPPPDYGPPHRDGAWGHRYPPPHYGEYWHGHRDHRPLPPPPPPPGHRHHPHDRW